MRITQMPLVKLDMGKLLGLGQISGLSGKNLAQSPADVSRLLSKAGAELPAKVTPKE